MKKIIKTGLIALLVIPAFVRCSDWTEAEALDYDPNKTESNHGEAHYANLRDYKLRKDHPVAFAWYSDWTGVGTDMSSQLMGMPDSMDFVSMWGNWYGLSDEKKEDLRKVQQIKGTRVLMCFIVDDIGAQTTPPAISESLTVNGVQYETRGEALGAFWGWYQEGYSGTVYKSDPNLSDEEAMDKAIRKYAQSLLDTINKYNWDGFDLDLEPHYGHGGNLASYPDRLSILLNELSKELGPQSGTSKMLCVDGEPEWLNGEDGKLLDYFILQAYNDSSVSSIDSRINSLLATYQEHMTPEQIVGMTILTSNFESYGSTGGPTFRQRDGSTTNQLSGYAAYSYPGVDARIGGIGAFRIVFDTNYQYLRKAIGIMNPAIL